jgi:purine-nucleoside/S-methyl-5'-thioadenosine phosphorylase / adenosine deaminase
MNWLEAHGVRWLEADLLGATAVFTTRTSGSAKETLEPLATVLGVSSERIAMAHQVHGADLVFDGEGFAGAAADGLVITVPDIAGLVFVADCLPVALAGPGGGAILHCGWRGLAAGIIAKGVAAVDASRAAIGPGIGACCYEVGDEVLDAFAGLGDGIASGHMLDLPEVARRLLRQSGVEAIESAGVCTRCEDELFFSHRREGGPGRQAGLVWLSPGRAERCPG